jgi:hypothetical protein
MALAQITEKHEFSIIKSIDDFDLTPTYNDASEICLPEDGLKSIDNFTAITDSRARDLFNKLERNPKARNRIAGGKCSYRRSYIQRYLRNLSISSGQLYIKCPSNNGRLRLIDQVTGRRYTFSNFHDTNVVLVRGSGHQVMDVQFKDRPVTLGQYLAQIEASQKLKPLRNRTSWDRGYCYWSVK